MNQIASQGQLRLAYLRWALFTVPVVVFLGFLSGRFANSGYGNRWFAALAKPALMPPAWMFGAAWTVLFVLMGLALAIVLHARGARPSSSSACCGRRSSSARIRSAARLS
jgi:tryptophan-rich sensory protein